MESLSYHESAASPLTVPSIQNLTRTMVLREDQAKATYTQKVDFAKLRSDLLSIDSTEASATRASHERLTNDLAKLNSRLRDEISRTQASVRLDLNLEKGRIREEANQQELKIKETETKIEQEVAGLREKLEGVKFQTLQWLMGVVTGTSALIVRKNPSKSFGCMLILFLAWCLASVDVGWLRILGPVNFVAKSSNEYPLNHISLKSLVHVCMYASILWYGWTFTIGDKFGAQ